MVDNSVPTGDVSLPGHARAALSASYALLPGMKVHLGIDNLFDRHYEMAVGFPAPGAVLRGGLSASL